MANEQSVASQVIKQLQDLGWNQAQATGIAANIQAESNFKPDATGDGGKAYGIAQWHPDRQQEFQKAYGKSIQGSTLAEQVAFIDHELRKGKEQGAGRKLAAAKDHGEAAAIVSQYYERPADKTGAITKRTAIANQLAGKPQMAQATPTGTQPNSAIAQEGASAINQSNLAMQALDRIAKEHDQVVKSAIGTLEGSKEDVALIKQTEELGKAKAQQRALDFATKIGSNPDAATEALSKLVEQSSQLFEQQRAVADRIKNANTPRNMFDNPVRWVADYLLEPFNAKKLQAVNAQVKSTTDQIKWINDTTQEYKQTMDAIGITKTQATAEAAARGTKAMIDIEVAKQQAEGLRFNSSNLMNTVNLSNNPLNIKLRLRDQELQEAQIDESRAAREAQATALQLSLADKEQGEAAKQSALQAYNLGAQNTGTQQFKTWSEWELYRQSNPDRANEMFATNYTNGLAQLEGTPPTVAATPYQALTFVAKTGAKLDPNRAALLGKIQTTYGAALDSTDPNVQKLIRNAKTAPEVVNRVVVEQAAKDAKDITKRGTSNFYAPPPLAALLEDQEIAKTYLASQILTPLAAGGVKEVPFDKAIPLLLDAVNKGKIPVAQADSELGFLATKIKLMNNDMYRYKATAGVPAMSTVTVPVKVPEYGNYNVGAGSAVGMILGSSDVTLNLGSKTARIDLLDPVARSTMFNKSQAAQLKLIPQTSKIN